MPTWEFTAGDTSGGGTYGSNLTRFSGIAGRLGNATNEAGFQAKVFSTYTWANLYVRVKTMTFVGSPTVRSRIGAVNGNLLATITGTGVFQDTVNTDALVSGNLVNFVVATPNEVGESTIFTLVGSTLQDTGTNATLAITSALAPAVNFGLTRFAPIGGLLGAASVLATTESTIQYTMRRAVTFTNIRVTLIANTINTGTTVWRLRVNGADVNQLANIAAGATGAFEDTTNTDDVVAGDEVNHQVTTSGTSGSINPRLAQLAQISTAREVITSTNSPATSSTDTYLGAEGDALRSVTESDAQIAARAAFTANNLFVNITAHGASNGVNFFLRQNGANSALTLNVPASTTGLFEDTTNSVSIAVADTYNHFQDHGGGAGSITVAIIGFSNGPDDALFDLVGSKLNILLRM